MAGVDRRIPIRTLIGTAELGNPVVLTGWVKTSRFSKAVSFVHVFDGSTPKTVQVVLKGDQFEPLKTQLGVGAAVRVTGAWVASRGKEQALEIAANDVEVVGSSDPSEYPLQKKRTSLEFLRGIAHLRSRSNTLQAVVRVRNALSWQIHRFFQERGFQWIHTPVITTADAEGAGEMFSLANATEFFGGPAFLSVSGQLEVECFAQSHTDVYTFGPCFRAENSNTARHVSEFWMIEPEMAFASLDDVIALAEEFVREVTAAVYAQCSDDIDFFDRFIEEGLRAQVEAAISAPFARVSHAEAQEILVASGRPFEFKVGPGEALQAEHERYLAEEHYGKPVFVTDYPAGQKAFYMRDNGDGTVAATDLLVPRLGEVLGGAQREERHDVLLSRMEAAGVDPEHLWWYLELRKFGSTPHGGFGLGFDRLLMWITGMQNIRDVIPFPRTPGHAEF